MCERFRDKIKYFFSHRVVGHKNTPDQHMVDAPTRNIKYQCLQVFKE